MYQQVIDGGRDAGDLRLLAPSDFLARSFVALENGYGMDVLSGTATATETEVRLLRHARPMTGTPDVG